MPLILPKYVAAQSPMITAPNQAGDDVAESCAIGRKSRGALRKEQQRISTDTQLGRVPVKKGFKTYLTYIRIGNSRNHNHNHSHNRKHGAQRHSIQRLSP